MGERSRDALRLHFDRKLKVEFHGTKVTSDAGLFAYRELDDALGLTTLTDSELCDNRIGKNTQHSIAALLRQSIYGNQEGTAYKEACCSISQLSVSGGQLGHLSKGGSQSGQAFALHDISNVRSGCSEGTLSGNP